MLFTRREAAKKVGRSPLTLRDWTVKHGVLPVMGRNANGEALHRAEDVLRAAKLMRRNYQARAFVAGSGRSRRHPATEEIRQRIKAGEPTRDIVNAIGCSERTVRRNRRELAAQEALQPPQNISEGKDTPD